MSNENQDTVTPNYTIRESSDRFKHEFNRMPHLNSRDSWFDASMEGNALWPQEGIGILVFLSDAVFSEGIDAIRDYAVSTPSVEQLDTMKKMMSNMHKTKGIPLSAEGLEHSETTDLVMDMKLRELWNREQLDVINGFALLADDLCEGKLYPYSNNVTNLTMAEQLNGLSDLFNNPKYSETVNSMKDLFHQLRMELKEPENIELAKQHKQLFNRKKVEIRDPELRSPVDQIGKKLLARAENFTDIPRPILIRFLRDGCYLHNLTK